MKLRSKRVGILLALTGTIAALLLEPVNGAKRRARVQRAIEPAGRPLRAVRRRLTGTEGGTPETPEGTALVERLRQVAVRAQGQIDVPDQPPAEPEQHASDGAAQQDGAARAAEEPKPRKRRKPGPRKTEGEA